VDDSTKLNVIKVDKLMPKQLRIKEHVFTHVSLSNHDFQTH
jgi:hypothetical protein